ncbi:hypothetical protein [Psychrobacter sp. DAB_AL43B]|nr:hypothetical protein [Psychrobacter sp. DAB_AL43B]
MDDPYINTVLFFKSSRAKEVAKMNHIVDVLSLNWNGSALFIL